MATTWRNWSGKLSATPSALHYLRTEADTAALAQHAAKAGQVIRPAGSAHSHYPLLPTNDIIVDTSGLSGLVSTDAQAKTAVVMAGTPIYAMGLPLHRAGLALANQGDIDRQSIGGAVATGTHGTGTTLTNLSAAVVGATVALASGEVVHCDQASHPELWRVAQLNLGAVGIVTQLTIQLMDTYRLRQESWKSSIDELMPTIEQRIRQHRHFEFFWYPTTGLCVAKATDLTTDDPVYPIGPEGDRIGWNFEVLPNHRDWPHTEMEYSVPADQGLSCLAALREMLAAEFSTMPYPIEYRTIAGDDLWISSASERDTVTISVHMDARRDDEACFRRCEEVFASFAGRPHWGKVHYRSSQELAELYPQWQKWWDTRDRYDPEHTFLNDALQALRPG